MKIVTSYIVIVLLELNFSRAQWDLISTEDAKFTYWSVDFTNDSTGYVAGGWFDSSTAVTKGVILRTIDGGVNWDTTFIDTVSSFRSINFPAQDTGYATSTGGWVYKTTNGGDTWTGKVTPANQFTTSLKSIFFVDTETGYACSSDGESGVIKTTDGGQNWIEDTAATAGRQVFFPSKGVGYTVTGAGGFKTMDSSATWSGYVTGTTEMTFLDLFFLNDTFGYLGGIDQSGFSENYGAIAKTIDGGATWIATSLPVVAQINSIHFVNENVGYAVGQGNTTYMKSMLKTENGGQTLGWQSVNNWHDYPHLLNVTCPSNSVCYAVGYDGLIFKTTNGGGAITYVGLGEVEKKEVRVMIYPNPTDGNVMVELNLSQRDNINLTIYDIKGRELLRKTVNDLYGKQRFLIDLSKYSEGAYLVQITTDIEMFNKKLIVTK